MPIREYQALDPTRFCQHCREPFERLELLSAPALTQCPRCGAPLRRLISAPAVGASASGLDNRARSAGFHKLKKLGHGEYEKLY